MTGTVGDLPGVILSTPTSVQVYGLNGHLVASTTIDCRVCAEKPHGSYPRWFVGSHCKRCHSSWRGTAAAHAVCCCRTFSSNAAADLHRVKGHCTDPALVRDLEKRLVFERVIRADGNLYWTPLEVAERGQIAGNYASGGSEGTVAA